MKLFKYIPLVLIFLHFSNRALYAQNDPVLVKIIDTSKWIPPSPDPAGIILQPSTGNLLLSDSEVNEIPRLFTGKNIFLMTYDGTLLDTFTTTSFSNEPTGISIDDLNNYIFFSDDNANRVFVVDLGTDAKFNTQDDVVNSFSTTQFGNNDPEDLSYGDGKLFISDGAGKKVFILSPGGNGTFDGVPPEGDDVATHFDTSIFNQDDPEGIAYNSDDKTLFIVSRNGKKVSEVTLGGQLIRNLDLTFLNPKGLSGVAYVPAATSERRLYVTDRGIDNDSDPYENDGKIYVIKIKGSNPSVTPIQTPTPGVQCNRGDGDGDGDVDLNDYFYFWLNFGKNLSGPQNGDFDCDGDIDLNDYFWWWQNFGTGG